MNVARVLTGVIGFPIVALFLIFADTIIIDIVFAIVAIMSLHEFYKAFKGKANPVTWIRICSMFINSWYSCNTK